MSSSYSRPNLNPIIITQPADLYSDTFLTTAGTSRSLIMTRDLSSSSSLPSQLGDQSQSQSQSQSQANSPPANPPPNPSPNPHPTPSRLLIASLFLPDQINFHGPNHQLPFSPGEEEHEFDNEDEGEEDIVSSLSGSPNLNLNVNTQLENYVGDDIDNGGGGSFSTGGIIAGDHRSQTFPPDAGGDMLPRYIRGSSTIGSELGGGGVGVGGGGAIKDSFGRSRGLGSGGGTSSIPSPRMEEGKLPPMGSGTEKEIIDVDDIPLPLTPSKSSAATSGGGHGGGAHDHQPGVPHTHSHSRSLGSGTASSKTSSTSNLTLLTNTNAPISSGPTSASASLSTSNSFLGSSSAMNKSLPPSSSSSLLNRRSFNPNPNLNHPNSNNSKSNSNSNSNLFLLDIQPGLGIKHIRNTKSLGGTPILSSGNLPSVGSVKNGSGSTGGGGGGDGNQAGMGEKKLSILEDLVARAGSTSLIPPPGSESTGTNANIRSPNKRTSAGAGGGGFTIGDEDQMDNISTPSKSKSGSPRGSIATTSPSKKRTTPSKVSTMDSEITTTGSRRSSLHPTQPIAASFSEDNTNNTHPLSTQTHTPTPPSYQGKPFTITPNPKGNGGLQHAVCSVDFMASERSSNVNGDGNNTVGSGSRGGRERGSGFDVVSATAGRDGFRPPGVGVGSNKTGKGGKGDVGEKEEDKKGAKTKPSASAAASHSSSFPSPLWIGLPGCPADHLFAYNTPPRQSSDNDLLLNQDQYQPRFDGDTGFRKSGNNTNNENENETGGGGGFGGGSSLESEGEITIKEIERKLRETGEIPVWVGDDTVEGAYGGFAKQVLWPQFHYVTPEVPRRHGMHGSDSWGSYVELNRKFAERVIREYVEGDIIFVSDYHLLLVPQMVRRELPYANIAFFLHIPFPSSEIFRCLSVRESLLQGILGSDLIGFQTYNFARHFRQTVARILQFEATPKGIKLDESWKGGSEDYGLALKEQAGRSRFVDVGVFPIGIDLEALNVKRRDPEVARWIEILRKRYAGLKIIAGRDKTDAIKGVRQKLLAFERFLEDHPEWHGKVVLVQVALQTTEQNESHTHVTEVVSRINSNFSSLAWQAIVYLHQDVSFSQYLAFLTVADVFLATSLRDGMNLSSHEYVACQDQGYGPLILSEFAGAYSYSGFRSVLAVNPFDTSQTARAIFKALTMSREEASKRWLDLDQHVKSQSAQYWITSFCNAAYRSNLSHNSPAAASKRPILTVERLKEVLGQSDITETSESISTRRRRLIVLDLERTLFMDDPMKRYRNKLGRFQVPDSVLELLTELVTQEWDRGVSDDGSGKGERKNWVVVMSGRGLRELRSLEQIEGLGIVAENGCWVRLPHGPSFQSLAKNVDLSWRQATLELLSYYTERTPGSFVEDHGITIGFRYLGHDKKDNPDIDEAWSRMQSAEIQNHIMDCFGERFDLSLHQGSTSFLVTPKANTRSRALSAIISLPPLSSSSSGGTGGTSSSPHSGFLAFGNHKSWGGGKKAGHYGKHDIYHGPSPFQSVVYFGGDEGVMSGLARRVRHWNASPLISATNTNIAKEPPTRRDSIGEETVSDIDDNKTETNTDTETETGTLEGALHPATPTTATTATSATAPFMSDDGNDSMDTDFDRQWKFRSVLCGVGEKARANTDWRVENPEEVRKCLLEGLLER